VTGPGTAGDNAALIRRRAGALRPTLALVLGSGLGPLADAVEEPVVIPYADLEGWPPPGVAGHAGALVLGRLAGRDVAVLKGRAHYYEHGNPGAMRAPIETLQAAGIRTLLLTNAAGSLRPDAGPGALMLLTDHIAWSGTNPFVGVPHPARFADMSNAYDTEARAVLAAAARERGIRLHEGVYMWFSGPTFETPAEIRAAKILGADAVGMSTVPEVIIARVLGLRCAAVSAITNFGAGLSGEVLSHEHTQANAARARDDMTALILAALPDLP
jgi:purine-nucleoside phosphorylase